MPYIPRMPIPPILPAGWNWKKDLDITKVILFGHMIILLFITINNVLSWKIVTPILLFDVSYLALSGKYEPKPKRATKHGDFSNTIEVVPDKIE